MIFYRMEFHSFFFFTKHKKKEISPDLVITHNLTTNMTPHMHLVHFMYVSYIKKKKYYLDEKCVLLC